MENTTTWRQLDLELKDEAVLKKEQLSSEYGGRFPINGYEIVLHFLKDELNKPDDQINWDSVEECERVMEEPSKESSRFHTRAYNKIQTLLSQFEDEDEDDIAEEEGEFDFALIDFSDLDVENSSNKTTLGKVRDKIGFFFIEVGERIKAA